MNNYSKYKYLIISRRPCPWQASSALRIIGEGCCLNLSILIGVWLIQDQETELVETSDVRNLALLIWVPNQCCIFKQDLATAVSQVHNFI